MENWNVINEINCYHDWCSNKLPLIIPNCRKDTIILDLTDLVGYRPSIMAYGPYSFFRLIMSENDYEFTKNDLLIMDMSILKYVMCNRLINSYIDQHENSYFNPTDLINMINWEKPDYLKIKTDNQTSEIFHHYCKRIKHVLDVNVCRYFKVPADTIYNHFNINGVVGINSPEELFNLVEHEGYVDYDSIKSLQWLDNRLIVPSIPIMINDGDELLGVKLEVDIFRGGYEADIRL